jgi:hypothetical protein
VHHEEIDVIGSEALKGRIDGLEYGSSGETY